MGTVKKKVVLLSCGSFNPITNMHLRMLELAKDALQRTGMYEVVKGLISPVNDDYNRVSAKKLVKGSHRVVMAKKAIGTSNWIAVDGWETEQSRWLPTLEILKHTKENIRNDSTFAEDTLVKLLCGGDLLESFAVPNLWKEEDIKSIVGDYGLVVITRQGSDPEKFIYESDILTEYKNKIFIVREWIYNDISSTKIRRALRRNESIKYIVPDPVIDFIKENGLYKS